MPLESEKADQKEMISNGTSSGITSTIPQATTKAPAGNVSTTTEENEVVYSYFLNCSVLDLLKL